LQNIPAIIVRAERVKCIKKLGWVLKAQKSPVKAFLKDMEWYFQSFFIILLLYHLGSMKIQINGLSVRFEEAGAGQTLVFCMDGEENGKVGIRFFILCLKNIRLSLWTFPASEKARNQKKFGEFRICKFC